MSFSSDPWITQAFASLKHRECICIWHKNDIHFKVTLPVLMNGIVSMMCVYFLPGVDLADWNIETSSNVLHSLIAL